MYRLTGMNMNDIILIDAGTGNLRSVQKALESVGANVVRTDDPQKVLSAKQVVLPGVGAFGDFMSGLRARGLEDCGQRGCGARRSVAWDLRRDASLVRGWRGDGRTCGAWLVAWAGGALCGKSCR